MFHNVKKLRLIQITACMHLAAISHTTRPYIYIFSFCVCVCVCIWVWCHWKKKSQIEISYHSTTVFSFPLPLNPSLPSKKANKKLYISIALRARDICLLNLYLFRLISFFFLCQLFFSLLHPSPFCLVISCAHMCKYWIYAWFRTDKWEKWRWKIHTFI